MRFSYDGQLAGAENMARDVAMLEAGQPAVRVYGWKPGAVSLGRSQDESVVDMEAARAEGLDVVRRPTGGGALLHDANEATYAIVVPRGWLPEDQHESYEVLSAGVVRALRNLGINPEFARGTGGKNALCYLRDEGVHVTVGGRKISGGAQRRSDEAVLQHGTLLVTRDASLMGRLFRTNPDEVLSRTGCLRNYSPLYEHLYAAEALLYGFQEVWQPLAQELESST